MTEDSFLPQLRKGAEISLKQLSKEYDFFKKQFKIVEEMEAELPYNHYITNSTEFLKNMYLVKTKMLRHSSNINHYVEQLLNPENN